LWAANYARGRNFKPARRPAFTQRFQAVENLPQPSFDLADRQETPLAITMSFRLFYQRNGW
jgi:hypothetical protein